MWPAYTLAAIKSSPMARGPGTSVVTPSMIDPPRVPVDTATVRRQFDARARRFARHDWLPREIGRRMVERLELMRLDVRRVADIGCGSGAAHDDLLRRYPDAQWLGFDLSLGMLRAAGPQSGPVSRFVQRLRPVAQARVCADAGQLPLPDACVDLVFSNLMLHWHPAPHRVIPEWRRVLRIDGLLMFSCFGPDTLKELRQAVATVEPRTRPMPYVDMHDFGDMLVAAGMATPVMDAEVLTLTFPSARARAARGLRARRQCARGPLARPVVDAPRACLARCARRASGTRRTHRAQLRGCLRARLEPAAPDPGNDHHRRRQQLQRGLAVPAQDAH